MSQVYLHIRDGKNLIEDPEREDLSDLDAARQETLVSARHLLSAKVKAGSIIGSQCIEIADETGAVLDVLPLKDALRLA